jgi:hypothetical protein
VSHAGCTGTINATSTAIPAAAAAAAATTTHDEPKDPNSTIFATKPTGLTTPLTAFIS